MNVNELVTLIANVTLALSFVIGLIFGIAQVRAVARDRRERLTLEELRNFKSREFAGLMQWVNSHDLPATRDALARLPVDEQVIFIQFSQEMEMLGILVAERLIDLDLVDKTLGDFVVTSWKKYKPMVLDLRRADPFMSEYFQWLAERIDERMRKSPRKPFFETALSR